MYGTIMYGTINRYLLNSYLFSIFMYGPITPSKLGINAVSYHLPFQSDNITLNRAENDHNYTVKV